jgi:hypothetical protein
VLNSKKFSLLIAGTAATVYIICSAFVVSFPSLSAKLMMALFHIAGNVAVGTRVTMGGFILGFFQAIIYAYVLGWVFTWIFNRSTEK